MSGGIARPAVDSSVRPAWRRTGYKFFPYATQQAGQWWVLRLNYDFPEHEMYTLFVDGRAALDVSGNVNHDMPLAASVGALKPFDPQAGEPMLTAELAQTAVEAVADYVVYGSEVQEPCDWCDHLADYDPLTRLPHSAATGHAPDS
jgi:hypothetical protein